jgi:hypothetical protein
MLLVLAGRDAAVGVLLAAAVLLLATLPLVEVAAAAGFGATAGMASKLMASPELWLASALRVGQVGQMPRCGSAVCHGWLRAAQCRSTAALRWLAAVQ